MVGEPDEEGAANQALWLHLCHKFKDAIALPLCLFPSLSLAIETFAQCI